ncbi:protein ANTAGONIST OF LIKE HETEROCHROMATIN PROTEIN 1-like [Drosophila innubila]|uniref:protein ANTAGONIST OF LIKE HETEROCHROMATIN PROTEIN 1-like n=1 Tax=Drosophila innubila TaxID=198719 RepID=UPI00148BF66C|nr:protein ANTAGONIST OF LIKE HETEROCHROMATIN PROTEIN 1-like [Drosophila innubila]
MNGRAHKAFMLHFFLDEGLGPQLAEAVQLVTTESAFNVLTRKTEIVEDKYNSFPRYQDDQFKEHFRMERSSFEALLQVVGKAIAGGEHHQPIAQVSLPEKLLYTLTLLSGKKSFREVGDTFAISKSSGHEIFKWVTAAFAALMPRYVKWPEDNSCGGRGINKLPGVVGVIDECRVSLKLPVREETGHRQYSALALQAVCDERSRFLDVHIDVPDMQCILLKSELFERLIDTEEPLMPPHKHLVGEIMYPLLINLMTPYTDPLNCELTPCHVRYNRAIHLWNAPAERAFAALISRFRRLESLDVSTLELGTIVVSATCMLHNFILDCGEPIEDAILDFEMLPDKHNSMVFGEHGLVNWDHTAAAEKKRDSLVASFIRA